MESTVKMRVRTWWTNPRTNQHAAYYCGKPIIRVDVFADEYTLTLSPSGIVQIAGYVTVDVAKECPHG